MALFSRMVMGALGLLLVAQAQAGVVITQRRVIYPADEPEATVHLVNEGKAPALVQTWLDNGADMHEPPETIDVPFTLSDPLLQVAPEGRKSLRLRHTGKPMPTDRESLFWLNVQDVPPKSEEGANSLRLAFRIRIKVFYRPSGLPGQPGEAPGQVRWQLVEQGQGLALKASNPTPYYVNLGEVALTSAGNTYEAGQGYVAPGETALFPLPAGTPAAAADAEVAYVAIEDSGLGKPGTARLSP